MLRKFFARELMMRIFLKVLYELVDPNKGQSKKGEKRRDETRAVET